jgi:hypothetical protein
MLHLNMGWRTTGLLKELLTAVNGGERQHSLISWADGLMELLKGLLVGVVGGMKSAAFCCVGKEWCRGSDIITAAAYAAWAPRASLVLLGAA